MEVTLKRAADYARAAGEAADKVKTEPLVRHSIHSAVLPEMGPLHAKLQENVDQIVALISAQFTIRQLIGAANERAGVNALLAERSMIDAQLKRVGAIVTSFEAVMDSEYERDAAAAQIVALREAKDRFYEKTVTFRITTQEQIDALKKMVMALKRRRADLTDRVAGLNLNTRITLPKEVVATLETASIIN